MSHTWIKSPFHLVHNNWFILSIYKLTLLNRRKYCYQLTDWTDHDYVDDNNISLACVLLHLYRTWFTAVCKHLTHVNRASSRWATAAPVLCTRLTCQIASDGRRLTVAWSSLYVLSMRQESTSPGSGFNLHCQLLTGTSSLRNKSKIRRRIKRLAFILSFIMFLLLKNCIKCDLFLVS